MFLGCQEADTFCMKHFNCNSCAEGGTRTMPKDKVKKLFQEDFKPVLDKLDTQEREEVLDQLDNLECEGVKLTQFFDLVKPLYNKDPEFFNQTC